MSRESFLKSKINKINLTLNEKKLVAVSKYYPMEDVLLAYKTGQRDFGEARVQELQEKSAIATERGLKDLIWHFIGHLQTNKVNALLKINNLSYIHSVHSFKLLKELCKKEDIFNGNKLSLFLQVNTSDEKEKSGFLDLDELKEVICYFKEQNLGKFEIKGLMTMGKFRTDDLEGDALICFSKLKKIRDELSKTFADHSFLLSMGMSQDYKIALDLGSDFVRVGSSIFS